jgi:hypothetical protein
MKNILGHYHDLELFNSNGNIAYKYKNDGKEVTETHYAEDGNIESQLVTDFIKKKEDHEDIN